MKEIVNELQLLQEVHFHANIIKFFGITKRKNNEDSIDPDYLFILEYADSGTLRDYLKENFSKLDLSTKLQFAIQISDAVSCLHQKNIIHRDLHSKNILVHQNKLQNGKRESPVPGMPDKYVEVYTSCWQCNPEDRPDIHQVFSDLKSLENKNEKLKCNNRDDNLCSWITNITNSLQIKLPESNTMEIDGSSFNFDYHKKLINKLFLLYEKFLQGGIDKDNYIQDRKR
ncbi:unnamed protein product [Rhizophagus irregularis]|nr:unnamed protein product [Rhizophagus irregularis]